MNKIAIYLNRHITGNVFDRSSVLEAYSTDRSALKIKPRLVALPESTSDLRKLVRFINQLAIKNFKLPIAVRGSGLDQTGADLTSGMVISTEKLNKIRELDAHDRLVHVQSGVTIGQLNSVIAPYGLCLPINVDQHETIGSLIANAPIDSYSGKYGGITNYIDRIEVVLSNGDILQTSQLSRGKLNSIKRLNKLEGDIYNEISLLIEKNSALIEEMGTKKSRSGYPALKYVNENGRSLNLLPIFYGSQGTLGIISEVILRVNTLPARPHRIIAVFNTFRTANEFLSYVKTLAPEELNVYDLRIVKTIEDYGKRPKILTKKFDNGFLVFASFTDKPRLSRKKVQKCVSFLPKSAYVIPETLKNTEQFNDIPPMILSFLNDVSKGERVALAPDFYIPENEIQNFLADLTALEAQLGKPLALFGSFSTGIYSIRPDFKLNSLDDRRTSINFLKNLNTLIKSHNGCLNGGSPEGRTKAIISNSSLTEKEKELNKKIKEIFDPNGILAPDIKMNVDARSTVRVLRSDYNQGIIS